MPIYDRPVRELMKEFVRENQIPKGKPFARKEVHAWFAAKYPKIKPGTINAHLLMLSTNSASRIHHALRKDGQDDFLFQVSPSEFRLYDASSDPTPIHTTTSDEPSQNSDFDSVGHDSDAFSSEFAYENDLKNYLAKNLGSIESGLRLYEDEGISGIEFPVGGRYIDILAKDKADRFVVIELKVSKGYDRVVGQILRYMGWIEKNLAEPHQVVRGIIVANHITEDLILATSRLHGLDLIEYRLSLEFKRITSRLELRS